MESSGITSSNIIRYVTGAQSGWWGPSRTLSRETLLDSDFTCVQDSQQVLYGCRHSLIADDMCTLQLMYDVVRRLQSRDTLYLHEDSLEHGTRALKLLEFE